MMKAGKLSRKTAVSAEKGGKKKAALIIDDEPALLDIYSTAFRSAGWDVRCASNGNDGLRSAEIGRPDVILLDIVMPFVDGFEILRSLKAGTKTKDIPVVILSNLGQDFEVKLGLSLGAKRFMVKASIEPARLVEEMEQILKD